MTGPLVSAFGLAATDGTFDVPVDTDSQGRRIFQRQNGNSFILFIEGRPGVSRAAVGTTLFNSDPADPMRRADLQIQSNRELGDGSAAVCDSVFPVVGGVPGINPSDFSPSQSVSNAINDLSCRFKVFSESDFACTQDSNENFIFANASSTVQFCILVGDSLTFSTGETVLSARLRDVSGRVGPVTQIVVRVSGT